MEMIKTDKISYDYNIHNDDGQVVGRKRAVNQVDLNVKKGDFIAILGRNGSGKSTCAKHLNAILVPTEGTVWVEGMDTRDENLLWEIRHTTGMIFQNPDNQIIGTVVEEDVGFGPENMGVPTEEILNRVDAGLEAVNMTKYRSFSPNKLSGGQKQRVAIAGILAMQPDCIVMDEPTAMLDPMGRREVVRTAQQLNKEKNITIILITHYMEEVTRADYVYVMDKGSVAMEGTPREIFSRIDEITALGLDIPEAAKLGQKLRQMGWDIPEGILNKEELVEAILKLKEN